jgi:peptidoglycan/LPS O-acetylase OafA/YrhL
LPHPCGRRSQSAEVAKVQLIRRIHLVVAWAFVAGLVIQVFLAGRGVFESAARFKDHAGWGYMLGLIPIILVLLAVAGRLGRRQVFYAIALFGMFILQSVLVALRDSQPTVAALHPVNGFAILLVAIFSAREAWAARGTQDSTAAVTAAEPASGSGVG